VRLLLDTHTFLWFMGGNPKLSGHVRQLIEDAETEKLLSIASLWEISIKAGIGKLKLNLTFTEMVEIISMANKRVKSAFDS
jgi:PIN domain nuclease of toxin-antitoxin system